METISSRLWYVDATGVWLLRQYTLCSGIEAEIVCWRHTELAGNIGTGGTGDNLCV